jgi:ABC-type transporter Mla MlaB component
MPDYKLTVNKDKQMVNIALEGKLTVANMEPIHKELTKALKGFKQAEINISSVDDADVTLLQTLLAFHKKFKNQQASLKINLNLNGELNNLFARSGALKLLQTL